MDTFEKDLLSIKQVECDVNAIKNVHSVVEEAQYTPNTELLVNTVFGERLYMVNEHDIWTVFAYPSLRVH